MNFERLFGLTHLTLFPLAIIMMGLPVSEQVKAALAIPVIVLASVFMLELLHLRQQMGTPAGLKAFLARRGFGRTTLYLEAIIGVLFIPWLLLIFSTYTGLAVFVSNALIVLSFVTGALFLIQSFHASPPTSSGPTPSA